jgi:head-tail adaptor
MVSPAYALVHRVLLRTPQTGSDGDGQPLAGFTNLVAEGDGMIWANVRFPTGLETIRAGAVSATTKASIRIRARAGLTSSLQAVFNGVSFNVRSVQPLPDRSFVDLVCEAST